MARKLSFVVRGEPVAQGRPKFTTASGYPRAYDPKPSAEYKQYIRMVASEEMGDIPPLPGPLDLVVRVYRHIPSSWSRKKNSSARDGVLRPTTKPDLDNYVKAVKDALKSVCWGDDSQVVGLEAYKYYSDHPRVEIEIAEVEVK